MYIVPESAIAGLIGPDAAFDAVEQVFAAMSSGKARNFPVIREALGHADALYGFKSGFDSASLALGLKSGGYWPGNAANGLTNHQSTVLLFDADTGRPKALVGGNLLTALRTAAAAAVSIKHLAPKNARTLGIIGAGHQAPFQLRAAAAQRPFDKIVAWNRTPDKLAKLAETAADLDVRFEAVSLDRLGAEADVIITIASSFAPILMDSHVTGPTHIAAMGTDTKGKQEIETSLTARTRVFTDEPAQSVTIGEAQHAIAHQSLSRDQITELGSVINGTATGRTGDEITLFDGTGVGLQDLAVAQAVLDLAIANGIAQNIDF